MSVYMSDVVAYSIDTNEEILVWLNVAIGKILCNEDDVLF